MITAIVFVKAEVARIAEVAEAIAALEGVSEVYSVTGQVDLIVLFLKMPAVRLRLVKVINHEQRSGGIFHHGYVRARSLPFVGAYRGTKRECQAQRIRSRWSLTRPGKVDIISFSRKRLLL